MVIVEVVETITITINITSPSAFMLLVNISIRKIFWVFLGTWNSLVVSQDQVSSPYDSFLPSVTVRHGS